MVAGAGGSRQTLQPLCGAFAGKSFCVRERSAGFRWSGIHAAVGICQCYFVAFIQIPQFAAQGTVKAVFDGKLRSGISRPAMAVRRYEAADLSRRLLGR